MWFSYKNKKIKVGNITTSSENSTTYGSSSNSSKKKGFSKEYYSASVNNTLQLKLYSYKKGCKITNNGVFARVNKPINKGKYWLIVAQAASKPANGYISVDCDGINAAYAKVEIK